MIISNDKTPQLKLHEKTRVDYPLLDLPALLYGHILP